MNKEEVHIIKIGEVVGTIGDKKPYLMVDEETDINVYYVNILREHLKDTYMIMKTSGIIRQPTWSNYNIFSGISYKPIKGIPDGDPIVGQSYTINNSS